MEHDNDYKTLSFPDRISWILDDIHEMLWKKNNDYGDAYNQDGILSAVDPSERLLCRMDEKIMRIRNLLNEGVDVNNEPLVDSFMDLAGSIILWIDRKKMQDVSES